MPAAAPIDAFIQRWTAAGGAERANPVFIDIFLSREFSQNVGNAGVFIASVCAPGGQLMTWPG